MKDVDDLKEEDVPMVVFEEKKEAEVEEVKPLPLEEVRELAITQACEKTFLNQSLLCHHGNIDPKPRTLTGTLFKRISAVSLDSNRIEVERRSRREFS